MEASAISEPENAAPITERQARIIHDLPMDLVGIDIPEGMNPDHVLVVAALASGLNSIQAGQLFDPPISPVSVRMIRTRHDALFNAFKSRIDVLMYGLAQQTYFVVMRRLMQGALSLPLPANWTDMSKIGNVLAILKGAMDGSQITDQRKKALTKDLSQVLHKLELPGKQASDS